MTVNKIGENAKVDVIENTQNRKLIKYFYRYVNSKQILIVLGDFFLKTEHFL